MAGRFPGAASIDGLWRLLMARGDAIRPLPPERRDARWDAAVEHDSEPAQAIGGFLDGVDEFDPTFFGISPREAEDIDPQQRLMLEATWQALEDAGLPSASLHGSRTGVYVGASWHDYELVRMARGARATHHTAVGTALDMIAARVSYFLRLRGPSLAVETGCSSSLVALHLACQALRSGEIDGALVGGVNLILAPDVSIGLARFGGLAPDGRCKAFAAAANGFVRGEGAVAIYLKPLSRALADGDPIRAVIAATAVNNDGGGASVVTPDPAGQEDLLTRAYAEAGISVDDVVYVEAHGTGTAVGDPIEAGALGRVLGRPRDRSRGPLAIGSIKTNIGHLEATAGLAGLVKTVLALEHRVVPPNLHGDVLNPAIDFDGLHLCVVREPLALPADGTIHAGVNSFGWGGTNAHAVLRSAPVRAIAGEPRVERGAGEPVLVAISAHSEEALCQRVVDLRAMLAAGVGSIDGSIEDLAATLAWKRDHFRHRAGFVARSAAELDERLGAFAAAAAAQHPGERFAGGSRGASRTRGRTAFVFPGQGAQWIGMGRALFATSPRFAAAIRRCAAALAPHVAWDLVACIAEDGAACAAGAAWSTQIDMLQPILWAISVALAELWRDAGVVPDVVVGHSQGEIAAATVAGILSYEDAASVVARRSALVRRTCGRGRMLAVDLDVAGVRAALAGFEDRVSVAVHNGPRSCVLSGDAEAVLLLQELLEADGTFCRLVKVDYASHGPHMDELADELVAALDGIAPRAATTALMSTVVVEPLAGPEMTASYWARNLRAPVRFADAMTALLDDGVTHVVEISPHPVLVPAIEQLSALRSEPVCVLATLQRDAGSASDFALALAHAYVSGLAPFHGLSRRSAPVTLPAYPWQRTKYGIPACPRRSARPQARAPGQGLDRDLALEPVAGERDAWQGTVDLALDDLPWLRDHRVHEAVVLPATAMMTFAFGAGRARAGVPPRTLVDVRLRRSLPLADDAIRVTAQWRDDRAEGGSFALLSLAAGATSWTEHATARIHHGVAPVAPAVFPAALRARPAMDAEAFYRRCAARGLHYGPAFQGVARVFVDGDEALAEVCLPDRCRSAARAHGLHPALWDAALQACLALGEPDRTVVPIAIARVTVLRDLAQPIAALWSHAVRRDATRFDLTLFDGDEQRVMTLEGLTLEPLARATPEPRGPAGAVDCVADRVHHLRFEEQPRGVTSITGESWLVCEAEAGAQDLAGELAAALTKALPEAPSDTIPSAPGDDRVRVAPYTGDTEDPQAAVAAWHPALRSGEAPAVVFLAPRASAGIAAQRRGLLALTSLVRACASLAAPPRLFVVTAAAQPVLPDEAPDPGAAMYVGFTRVIRREHPELQPVLVDVVLTAHGWAAGLAAELVASDGEDQVALRGERRFIGRLVREGVVRGACEPAPPGGTPQPAHVWTTPRQPFRLHVARPGFWDTLEYRPLARRAPAANEIEVEVTAAALNFIDVMKAMGTYPGLDGRAPLLGGECAGRVVRVGVEVAAFAIGDRVVACGFGAFAAYVTVRADHAQRIPDHLHDETAVTLPLVLTTAWYGLHDLARLEPGETVLLHSAAGGLGLAAIQVARALGARILATAGSEEKRRYLRALGIADVFDSRDLAWADGVRAATGGRGVDVILNALTGAAIPLGLDALAEDGRFIEVGKQDIHGDRRVPLTAFQKGISLAAVDLAGLMERRPQRFARALAAAWARVASGQLRPLPATAYAFSDAADALRAMSRGNHVGKLVLTAPGSVRSVAPEPMPHGRLRGDATYLITGGLGALGLSLAEFLADHGAGALALAGRAAPDEAAGLRLAALRARGVRVETFALDVADDRAVTAALAELRRTMPALRGVVHAAGVLDDATLAHLTASQIERVLAPKVDGARHLDAATAEDPLDLFVMFSSAAALVGNAGQAAYAAANAFLDALAVARRRRRRPALSVQWGPFAEIGLAARDTQRGARLAERGMTSFPAADAWPALVHFLHGDEPVVAYVSLDLRRWFDAYPETAAQPSWQALRAQASQTSHASQPHGARGPAATPAFRAELAASPSAHHHALSEAKVRELAGRVLRLDASQLDGETPLKALGLDSLLGLELRNRLESAFGLALSPTLLWTCGTTRSLATLLCERVFGASSSFQD